MDSETPTPLSLSGTDAAINRFRLMATLEGWSWAALLVGMLFKYQFTENPIGVRIAGPIHGVLFVAYILCSVQVATSLQWPLRVRVMAMLAAFPPFCTVWFERWATRNGSLRRADNLTTP
ncbi:MAG: DUF3817 domain-containing protein [Phycisphaerae bacterium]|jgi:integral membrane protein|nr:DUF3817 domain-containing protein [Phycisphaerae bacterium]